MSDKSIIKILKKIKTEECFVAFTEYYKTIFPRKQLSKDEFDDLFSPILNNTTKCYNKLAKEGTVEIYEAFVAMTLFSEGDFDLKLLGMFRSFDVDESGTIDRAELLNFILSGTNGLFNLLGLQEPNRNEILDYSSDIFNSIDRDNSGKIDFEEFKAWIKNSHDLQDFTLKYTGVQTFESA